MPTLEWIGKDKVVNHHQEVPYRVLERQYSYDEAGQHAEIFNVAADYFHRSVSSPASARIPQRMISAFLSSGRSGSSSTVRTNSPFSEASSA